MSHLDVLMQTSETVYSHLTKKKKELKRFLGHINANNSYNFRIRTNIALFIELNLKELVKYFVLVYSICY